MKHITIVVILIVCYFSGTVFASAIYKFTLRTDMQSHSVSSIEFISQSDTNITYKDYYKFVKYVRDSTALRLAVVVGLQPYMLEYKKGKKYPDDYKNPNPITSRLNLNKSDMLWKMSKTDEETASAVSELFLPQQERFYREKQFDMQKLKYEFTDSYGNTAKVPVFATNTQLAYFNDLLLTCSEPKPRDKTLKKLDKQLITDLGQPQREAFYYWKSKICK